VDVFALAAGVDQKLARLKRIDDGDEQSEDGQREVVLVELVPFSVEWIPIGYARPKRRIWSMNIETSTKFSGKQAARCRIGENELEDCFLRMHRKLEASSSLNTRAASDGGIETN
jgi:hypothetical protein